MCDDRWVSSCCLVLGTTVFLSAADCGLYEEDCLSADTLPQGLALREPYKASLKRSIQCFLHLLTYSSRCASYNALLPKHTHPELGPSQWTKHSSFSVSSCLFNFVMRSLCRFVMYTMGTQAVCLAPCRLAPEPSILQLCERLCFFEVLHFQTRNDRL